MKDPYYSLPEVSNSDLCQLRDLLYGREMPADIERIFAFGNLIDFMITEPHKVDIYNRTADDMTFSREEIDQALAMKKSYFKDAWCAHTHKLATFQHIVRREIEFDYCGFKFSLPMRCKFDRFFPVLGYGDDIKSTACETEKQCKEALYHFDYDQSRALYMLLANSHKDMLIFISKKNYKVFKIPITRQCEIFERGLEKLTEIAFKYWMLVHDLKIN